MRPGRALRAALLGVLAAVGFGLGPVAGVAAAAVDESVPSFDAQIDVDARGDLHVTETIAYDFGGAQRHGVWRELRTGAAGSGGHGSAVSDVTATSPSGAPVPVVVIPGGALTTVRIGDSQRTVTGRQTYVLRYTVRGAVGRLAPDELAWDVTGSGWTVPIDRVAARVRGPVPATAASCRRGAPDAPGATGPCTATAGATSTFSAERLAPGQGLAVVLDYPAGTVARPEPPAAPGGGEPGGGEPGGGEPGLSPAGRALGIVLLLVVLGGLVVLARVVGTELGVGHDPVPDGPTPAPAVRPVRPRVVADGPSPPPGLRPGQLATLRAGRVEIEAVVGTVLDLARRGHVLIEEPAGAGRRHGPARWAFVRPVPPPDDRLLPYEKTVLETVLGGADWASLGDVRTALARDHTRVRAALLADAVARGWFRDGDEGARARWRRLVGGRAPLHRSDAGDAVLAGTDGFRAELAAMRAERIARAADVQSRSLPYAVALGLADPWVVQFEVPRQRPARRGGSSRPRSSGFDSFRSSDWSSGSGSSSSGGSSGGGGSW